MQPGYPKLTGHRGTEGLLRAFTVSNAARAAQLKIDSLLSRRNHQGDRIAGERDNCYRAADGAHFNALEEIGCDA